MRLKESGLVKVWVTFFLFGEGRGNDSQQRIRNRSSPSDVLSKARDVSVE